MTSHKLHVEQLEDREERGKERLLRDAPRLVAVAIARGWVRRPKPGTDPIKLMNSERSRAYQERKRRAAESSH